MDTVVILAHNRPEQLRRCVEHVRRLTDANIIISVDNHVDNPTPAEVGGSFLKTSVTFRTDVIINEHMSPGNAHNTREGLRHAIDSIIEPDLVHLIEDDVMVSRDYFEWSRAVHNRFQPFAVSGYHKPGDLWNEGSATDVYQNHEFIHTFAISFRPENVRTLLPKLTVPLDAVLNGPDRNLRTMITPARSRCAHGTDELPEIEPWTDVRMTTGRLLVAVESCQRDMLLGLHKIIRKTWAQGFPGDVKFFVGGEMPTRLEPDEVWLNVPDDYLSLPKKTREIMYLATSLDYDHIMKVDCDTVVLEQEFRKFDYQKYDYSGFFWSLIDAPGSAASGFCYILSRKAAEIVAKFDYKDAREVSQWAEDQMVGDALRQGIADKTIKAVHIPRHIASAVAGRGEPHEPANPYPSHICEITVMVPGQKPYNRVLPKEKALWYLRTGVAKLVWPKSL